MPEDTKDHSSSGGPPQERKPTIIGTPVSLSANAPQERKPTVIGVSQPVIHTPTTIPAEPHVVAEPIRPTILAAPPPKSEVSMAVKTPSVMPGHVRKGIDVTVDELQQAFPGTPESVLKRVVDILDGTVPELLTDAMCVRWGELEQQRYGELTAQAIKLIASQSGKTAQNHLHRLNTILEELSAALAPSTPEGLFMFKKPADPRRLYEAHQDELVHLAQLLQTSLPELVNTSTELAELVTTFTELEHELDAQSLAARHIADRTFDQMNERGIQSLLDRSISLVEARALIQQGHVLRSQAEQSQRLLVSQIQEGVLNALPAWMETVTIMFQRTSQNPTELYTLRTELGAVIDKLK